MLKSLSVENYVLIDRLAMELSGSLNIITGETGAGKSILLGALGLLMGARADAQVVRDAGRNCVVEGIFDISKYNLTTFFDDNDLDYEPMVTVRRVISAVGKSRAYINDLPVQQTVLKELSIRLLDVHSQHQNLLLAEDSFRTSIVDGAAGSGTLLTDYRAAYDALRAAERELAETKQAAARGAQERDWLEFQVAELVQAALRDGEQEELEAEQQILAHAEEIKSTLAANAARLDGDERSIVVEMKSASQSLTAIVGVYTKAEELAARFESVYIELRDLEGELAADAERIDSDPLRLSVVDERLAAIYTLKQKHHVDTVAQLLDIQHDYQSKLDLITGSDEAVAALTKRVGELHAEAVKRAAKLTTARRKAAAVVQCHVEEAAAALGIPAAKFVVEIAPLKSSSAANAGIMEGSVSADADVVPSSAALRPSGADEIRFLFSANKNVAPAPVEKTASGGETSRIMLALKALVARSRDLPTIIFDEIDTGVSGSVADAMGRIIEQLAATMQVVDITHLPQVASKGNTHFVVYKDAKSHTQIRCLTPAERVEEIAQMLSGQNITDAAREQARLLLG